MSFGSQHELLYRVNRSLRMAMNDECPFSYTFSWPVHKGRFCTPSALSCELASFCVKTRRRNWWLVQLGRDLRSWKMMDSYDLTAAIIRLMLRDRQGQEAARRVGGASFTKGEAIGRSREGHRGGRINPFGFQLHDRGPEASCKAAKEVRLKDSVRFILSRPFGICLQNCYYCSYNWTVWEKQ